jgi:aminopeptidase N
MLRRALLPTLLLALGLVAPPAASAQSPGATSLGDPLIPQIGNGGYDVSHYDLRFVYDPVANRLGDGTKTTITATATQALSSFSLDFQRDLPISSVTVDGQPASFEQRDAKPKFSEDPKVTQPAKLFVTPAAPLPDGQQFTVEVAYSGVPAAIVDADESLEGWVHACSKPDNCDGAFTVNEPIGAQGWYPCNNYATDKASFTTTTTVPDGYTALGTGELVSTNPNGDGTTTWHWNEDDPTATYLTTATVGKFTFDASRTMLDRSSGTTLPVITAIDSSAPKRKQARKAFDRIPSMVNFVSKRFGPYPFDSVGAVADWVPSVGYALENETKPHFAGTSKGLDVPHVDLEHELTHQWTGDAVSARTWQQIWWNEGMATFSEVFWDAKANGSDNTPRDFFNAVHRSKKKNFRLAPADLKSPANLFDGWAVYNRPGAMFEGFREIVGNKRFFRFVRRVLARHAYSTVGERDIVRAAQGASGLHGRKRNRLRRYFDQWLHREGVPSLAPRDF